MYYVVKRHRLTITLLLSLTLLTGLTGARSNQLSARAQGRPRCVCACDFKQTR